MSIKQERDLMGLREIQFYGEGAANLLKENVKLLTLRKPNSKYDFEAGEVILADCRDTGEKVRLVVIDNLVKPLSEYSDTELLLDGYEGVYEAADDLKKFPGYEDIDADSPMQGIVTISEELFLALPEEVRADLVKRGVGTMNDVEQPYKELFWPAWCRWVASRGGGVREWRYFLMKNDLVYYNETSDKDDGIGSRKLLKILKDRRSPFYRSTVMFS